MTAVAIDERLMYSVESMALPGVSKRNAEMTLTNVSERRVSEQVQQNAGEPLILSLSKHGAGLLSRLLGSTAWAGAFLAFLLVFSACPPPRPEPPAVPHRERATPTPTHMLSGPTPTPTTRLEESAIGETPVLGPPPGAMRETPLPTATPAPEVTSAEPESLVTHIGPGTAPNVAAALRVIEDGRQQIAKGAYDAALERFERAVAIDPTNAYGYYFLARVHFLKKDYDQAIAFASRAAALNPRRDQLWLGRIYGLQGAVFEEVGRYPDARKAYQQAVDADPNNLAARVGVARLSGGGGE